MHVRENSPGDTKHGRRYALLGGISLYSPPRAKIQKYIYTESAGLEIGTDASDEDANVPLAAPPKFLPFASLSPLSCWRQVMFIQTLVPPVAGKTFRFTVAGCSGETLIEVYTNNDQILDRKMTGMLCKSAAEIPLSSAGSTLRICASDSSGNRRKLEFEISESDPGAHSMLAKSRQEQAQQDIR